MRETLNRKHFAREHKGTGVPNNFPLASIKGHANIRAVGEDFRRDRMVRDDSKILKNKRNELRRVTICEISSNPSIISCFCYNTFCLELIEFANTMLQREFQDGRRVESLVTRRSVTSPPRADVLADVSRPFRCIFAN